MGPRKLIFRGILAVLLAAGEIGSLASTAISAPTQRLAQLTPGSITGQLDENSQTLDDGNYISYFNVHTFEGETGTYVSIEMVSEEFDAYLILLGPEGNLIVQDNNGGDGTNARLAVTLPSTGTYQILANSYNAGATGQYRLTWRLTTAADVANDEILQHAFELNEQAIELYQQGQYSEAESLFLQSLEIHREQLGESHPEVASNFNNLAELYRVQGRYSEAEPLLRQALEIYQEQLGETDPNVAASLHNLASLYRAQGLYSEAEPLYLQALEIVREQLGEAHPNVASSLNDLALLYGDQGRYSEAEPLYLQALEIYREQLGEDHPNIAVSLNNLALLNRAQGRYSEAESLYLQALEVRRGQLGEAHPDTANSLINLASLYLAQGRYSEAESLYLQALEIYREQLGETHPNVAINLNNLASLYRAQGRYGEAESFHSRALEIQHEQLGEAHPDVATSLNNLALLYLDQGRYSEAESICLQALKIRQEQLGEAHPDTALSLNNLALIYRAQNRYAEAEPLYLQALKIYREQLGERHPRVATALNNIASLYETQNRYTEAEPIYLQALKGYREQLGEAHPYVAVTLNNLAWLYQAQGDIEAAVNHLQTSLNVQEQNLDLNLATLTDAQRRDYVASVSHTAETALSLHLKDTPANSDAARLALTTLLRRKGRLLDAGINSLQVLRQNLTPEDQALFDDFTAVRQQLAQLTFNPPPALNAEQYRSQLAQLELEAADLEKTLAQRSARFGTEAQPVGIEAVQAQIPANAVLIEYVRYFPFEVTNAESSWGDARYAAYLLFPDGRIEAADLGDAAEIDTAVQAFGTLLQSPSTVLQGEPQSESVAAATGNLRTLILDPITPYLADREHLLISPDSELNRIPFEALQTEEEGSYLVEQYQISYLNSGRDLLKFTLTEPSTTPALILANPDYDTADSSVQIAQVSPTSQPETRSLASDRRSSLLSQLQFRPLPGTAAEAEAIERALPNARVLTTDQATENVLKAIESPRILHIATHGFFLKNVERFEPGDRRGLGIIADASSPVQSPEGADVENPLLRSGLALAGFNTRSSGSEDGVLTALEVSSLNLSGTQLVVLSACETGLGDIANGEGVYGLRRAFAIAGAETQLMSLWLVSDDGTQELMARYYQKLTDGMGRSEALRATQLEMIDEDGRYSHPYYWASFILAGDWQPLE